METDRYPDLLKEALSRQQRATLPTDFSVRTLQRLQREKRIREQRAEIMGFVVATIVSLALIVMAGAILHHYGILPSRESLQEMFASMKGRAKFFMTESLPYYGSGVARRHTAPGRLSAASPLVSQPPEAFGLLITTYKRVAITKERCCHTLILSSRCRFG